MMMAQPRPVTLIFNRGSGNDEKLQLRDVIEQAITAAGRTAHVVELKPGPQFLATCERLVQQAAADGDTVIAAGGDGTINLAAGLCAKHDAALGVIPLGTFNYFARELGIPADPAAAAQVAVTGVARPVTVGYVQDRLFLNNASFGLYTTIIRNRERANSRFGRMRIVAALSAAHSLIGERKRFAVKLTTDQGHDEVHRTSMVFVGNNTMQLSNVGLEAARCTEQDRLAIVVVKPMTRMDTARVLLRGALKTLGDESQLEEFCARHIEVETRRREVDVAIDGEIVRCRTPLRFRSQPAALRVVVPAEQPPAQPAETPPASR